MRPVAVFDTNVLLSGLVWRGNPYRCLELARARTIEGVTCIEILNELTDKLQAKLQFTLEQAVDTLADLLTFLRVVPITGQVRVVAADPDDDKVLECAIAARATQVITGDRKHLLPLVKFQGISILSPTDFLSVVLAP